LLSQDGVNVQILWIASVWPEPKASAAGIRTMELIRASKRAGHEVQISSPSKSSEHREKLIDAGFITHRFEPNDSTFDTFLKSYSPDVVVFDRFMIEEQFGWRVREHAAEALRVLDTIDLHSLRRARERSIISGRKILSDTDLNSEDAIREVSSILRSDFTLLVSEYEKDLLISHYGISKELLEVVRWYYAPIESPDFDSKKHFVTIGNFNHSPNRDSVRILQSEIWKKIKANLLRKGVIDAELHIYGAYPTREFMDMDDPASGFRVKGWAEDSISTLKEYRVNLAPLRFGAGIKGKVSDGWASGTPCVGTSVAAEGMCDGQEFGGFIADDWESFSENASLLYLNRIEWENAKRNGDIILKNLFSENEALKFISSLTESHKHLIEKRIRNFTGSMLWHHQNRSTEYFSRWIELKNRSRFI